LKYGVSGVNGGQREAVSKYVLFPPTGAWVNELGIQFNPNVPHPPIAEGSPAPPKPDKIVPGAGNESAKSLVLRDEVGPDSPQNTDNFAT